MKSKFLFFPILLLFLGSALELQASPTEKDSTSKKAPLKGFSISGNYRFYLQHRFFTNPYVTEVVSGEPVALQTRSILIGDASQLPELTLNISGRPTSKTSFGTDLVVWNQNTGFFNYYRNLQLGVNLYGSFATPIGNVSVKAGGIHWHSMTPFTLKAFAGYNRYSIFERNPWDPQFNEIDRRYSEYHAKGAVTQDVRWGNQAFQGFMMDLTELPWGLSANVLYGKTQNAGSAFNLAINPLDDSTNTQYNGFFENSVPNNVFGGRIIKRKGKSHLSLNTFSRRTYSDLKATLPVDNQVHTAEFFLDFKKASLSGELGAGRYQDVYQDKGFGSMASLKLNLAKSLTRIPFELHAFRISPNVVNNNSEFVNTSVAEATSAASGTQLMVGSNGVLQQTGSAMLGIGQMANNRMGINLNADIPIGNLNIIVGNGIAKEIERKNNQITYGHLINGLTMSRFYPWSFPSNVGPYNHLSVLYRGVFETVYLTDLSPNGQVVNDKYFNNIEAQVKYKFDLFKRPWYVFYLGSYNSVQTFLAPVTVFTEKAYLRYYAHQLENYYTIHPKLVLAQYLGWERVIGNYDTQVDIQTRRPRNQEGWALGFGLDYLMAKNTALYLRHRYFKFEDRAFTLDRFAGHESTLELKIFF